MTVSDVEVSKHTIMNCADDVHFLLTAETER